MRRLIPILLLVLGCQDAQHRNAERVRELHKAGDYSGLARLLDSDDADLRCRAAKTLAWVRGTELAATHRAILTGGQCDWKIRAEAAWRLFEEEAPDLVPALTAGFADPTPEVRWNVARVLGVMRVAEARPALALCLSDPDKFVVAWCRWADCKITGSNGCRKPNMSLVNGKPAP